MRRVVLLVPILAALCPASLAAERLGYYRFPDVHGDTVVFCAEGDLYRVPIAGGVAQRLTTHLASESRPAVSPDGATIAFSASYEGPTEVYTMPASGGLPVRRTYEGESALVVGFPENGKVLYATQKFSTLPETQLVTIDLSTGEKTLVPLAQAADGTWDPATGDLYFTRFAYQGSHTKRYKGGTAQNVWKLPRGAKEAAPLTADFPGTSKEPHFWKGRVYFASDRDGTMNLWSMDAAGKDLKQHTRHVGFDVKDPALSEGRIAYQLGADLRVFDVATGADRAIPITLVSDFDQMREKWIRKPVEYLTAVHLSPDGGKLVLTARGQVFVAPVKQGRFVEARRKSGVRYRQARFLTADSIAALSDESGEVEWWKLSADGLAAPERLTKDGKVLRFNGVPSPDGKWIAHHDQDQELWLYGVDSKESRKVDFSPTWGYDSLTWSPDSRWLAYSRGGDNLLARVFVYDVAGKELTPVTTDRYDSYSPAFAPDGKWLYFLSDRAFRSVVGSPWGSRQPEPYFDQPTKIYHLALREGLRSPFAPDDELHEKDEKKEDEKKDEDKKGDGKKDGSKKDEKEPPKVEIALDGIEERLFEVPVPPGNFYNLSVAGERLYWLSQDSARDSKVKLLSVVVRNTDVETKTLVEGVGYYEISADGKKILIRKGDDFHVVDTPGSGQDSLEGGLAKGRVDLSSWTFPLDPREEWRQIFVESWRLERDYFYDRGMHGVDWKGVLAKYLPLVDRVTNRSELADLQAQMAGELSALHTFVGPGDQREGQDEVEVASLGAVFARDEKAGGFRVTRLYEADPDSPRRWGLSPAPGSTSAWET
jgi:tricorn protease